MIMMTILRKHIEDRAVEKNMYNVSKGKVSKDRLMKQWKLWEEKISLFQYNYDDQNKRQNWH